MHYDNKSRSTTRVYCTVQVLTTVGHVYNNNLTVDYQIILI